MEVDFMDREPTLLGTVQDVRGATISVSLDQATASGLTFVEGQAYRVGQVGSFVRIPLGYVDLFGIVAQVGAGSVPEKLLDAHPFGNRWLTVQLVGEGERGGAFQRGLSQYPTIDDKVYLVTDRDLARIYGRPDNSDFVRIGHLASADSIPALVSINKLVTRHSAVVGSTGAGKSTTVAGLLATISSQSYPSARIVVFDIHGEYARALSDRATVYRVNSTGKDGERVLHIPYWALTFDELLSVTFGNLDEAGRTAVQDRIVSMKRATLERAKALGREFVGSDVNTLTVDSPIPFSIHELWFELHCLIHATHYEQPGVPQSRGSWALEMDGENPIQPGDAPNAIPPRFRATKDEKSDPEKIRLSRANLNISRPLDALGGRLRDPRFDFLFKPGPWACLPDSLPQEDLDTLLKQWLGSVGPVAILDLSGVPALVLSDLVAALLRTLFDSLFWSRRQSEGSQERPLLIVLEEAHSYVSNSESGPSSQAVRRIAREGRKYGLGIMLVSQRPSEIDTTVLSQCGTLFAMRLSNSSDRGHVSSAAPDNLDGLFSMLPILRTGEAIVVGEAVNLPLRALISAPPPNQRPDGSDPAVVSELCGQDSFASAGGWNQTRSPESYEVMLQLWRQQTLQSQQIEGPVMERTSVSSSSIASVGYDGSTSTLEIEFLGGAVYQYFDVSQVVYEELMSASSHGQYLAHQIKPHYRYARS